MTLMEEKSVSQGHLEEIQPGHIIPIQSQKQLMENPHQNPTRQMAL